MLDEIKGVLGMSTDGMDHPQRSKVQRAQYEARVAADAVRAAVMPEDDDG